MLGIGFEPVSFYYVFDKNGERVRWIVAEVNNIPWFEQHCYVLSLQDNNNASSTENEEKLLEYGGHDKVFHVSPFMDIKYISYVWHFSKPGKKQLRVHSYLQQNEIPFFKATLDLKKVSFTRWNLFKIVVILMPLLPIKVMMGIFWEALKLWNRGFLFYSHPDQTETWASRAIARGMDIYERFRKRFWRQGDKVN